MDATNDKAMDGLARFQTIKRFAILPRPLSMETDELTPTLKLKRRIICQNYAEEIDALYAAKRT